MAYVKCCDDDGVYIWLPFTILRQTMELNILARHKSGSRI